MSQSGILTDITGPAANVETISDNAGNIVTPSPSFDVGVVGKNSVYTAKDALDPHKLDIMASASYLVGPVGIAPFNTIAAAIIQAVADGVSATNQANIVIKPGVYNESLFVNNAGMNFIAWDRQMALMESPLNTTVQRPSVYITGSATITAQCKFIGIGFLPTVGTNPFFMNAGAQVALNQCKVEPFNAAAFRVGPATVQLYLNNCTIAAQDTSASDKFADSVAGGLLVCYCNNTFIDVLTASTGVNIQIKAMASSIHSTFNFTGTLSSNVFQLENCYCDAGTTTVFITSDLVSPVQMACYNTTFVAGSQLIVSCPNASSFYKFYNCTLFNGIDTGAANVEKTFQNTSIYDSTNFRWVSYVASRADGNRRILENFANIAVRDSLIVGTAATNASTTWAALATRGFSIGVLPTASNVLRMTTNNTDDTDASAGTTIWTVDPTNTNLTTYSTTLSANGGFAMKRTLPGAYPYTALVTDVFISVNTSVARTINLPDTLLIAGQVIYIKDATGTAAANNITVQTTPGLALIDGFPSFTINSNYAAYGFLWDGTNYEVF